MLNDTIIFSIQRFNKNLRIKNHSFVSFPEIVDLKKVKSCVQLQVFVNSAPDFINQHLVANGASDLVCEYLDKITGNKSIAQHTRCAVGVATLPLGALVEVGAVFEI